VFKKG